MNHTFNDLNFTFDEELLEEDIELQDDDDEDVKVFDTSFYSSAGSQHLEEFFSLGSFDHKLLYACSNLKDDVKHGYDPIAGFVIKKEAFISALKLKLNILSKNDLLPPFQMVEKQIAGLRRDRGMKIPLYVPRHVKFVQNDPDMHFFGHYNWCYTGGTLQTVKCEDFHSLVFVEKADKDTLCVAPVKKRQSCKIDTSQIAKVVPSNGEEIFQVKTKKNSRLIGVCQKNVCTVFTSPDNKTDNTLHQNFSISSEDPITSFDLSAVHNELCFMSTNFTLSYWDMSEEKIPASICCQEDKYDKWRSLWYSSSSPCEVVVADRKAVKWYDRRSNHCGNTVELKCLGSIEDDEEISLHFESERNPQSLYIGTNISLLLIDSRMLDAPIHRWSHRMVLPPLYSSVVHLPDDKELACIGNHFPGDVVLAFSSSASPFPLVDLPSKLDSLLYLQSQGECLDPSLRPRCSPGLAGLTSVTTSGAFNTEILTQSLTCDIYSQAVFKSYKKNNQDFSALMSRKEKLYATERWDMSKVYNKLCYWKPNSEKPTTSKACANTQQVWQQDLKELKKYKDVLSSFIVEEWEDDINEEVTQKSNAEKVSAWLNMIGDEVTPSQDYFALDDTNTMPKMDN